MNIIVVGCGKVGSMLASSLSREGHDVAVVDRVEENFSLLDSDFVGFTIPGVPIDQDVLKQAGIEGCDAICAMTQDDNVNIMVCQLAKELFHVPIVLARTFDPRKRDTFRHFGINTVCPTRLTVETVKAYLQGADEEKQETFFSSTVSYRTMNVSRGLVGKSVSNVRCMEGEVVFAVAHANGTLTLAQDRHIDLQESDHLIFARVID